MTTTKEQRSGRQKARALSRKNAIRLQGQSRQQLTLLPEDVPEYEWTADDWATPPALVAELEQRLGRRFDLDVCAVVDTAKAPRFFHPTEDGLAKDWGEGLAWCNPPYSAVRQWLQKAIAETKAKEGRLVVVMLLPAHTDLGWFHDYCLRHGRVEFLRGRVKFLRPGNIPGSPTFGSILVYFGETP